MANFSLPALSSTYTNFVTEINNKFSDLALALDPATTTPTNLPTNSIRLSSAAAKWQKWNGSSWVDAVTSNNYAINITGNAATSTSASTCTGNSVTATTASTCTGNSVTATTASTCTGNSASATTAAACSGNSVTATTAATCTGNAASATTTTGNAATATTATYVSTATQTNIITGKVQSMPMTVSDTVSGSFTARSTGTGDANLAGMAFYNDNYAIKLGIRSDGYFGLGGWSRAAWSWYSDPSGNMVAAGNVTAYSDPRLKKDFTRVEKPLELLKKLDGGTFIWREGFKHTEVKAGKRDYGILADQVKAIMPEIVTPSAEIDGQVYDTVSYEKLVPVLIEAIKELEAKVSLLESKNNG